jgi:hypothetical protein
VFLFVGVVVVVLGVVVVEEEEEEEEEEKEREERLDPGAFNTSFMRSTTCTTLPCGRGRRAR